ncbi:MULTISPECIES: ATP-binding cassette domain-containing protein [unclassified Actinopolyspora]|uniref:ATP-binding cassette domain-containing protein n=1 Tax=unclassified Actinopolyspora TaxID=2639451 RepID=UPI0013F5DC61|nr:MULTISPECIES: ATP-binding cassette domain-containing protein [unclassified Actinopolyspora]NHD18367.1 ATP-binding cassette domain-containing protein [Actinopolyspora sp. BKK2]NHE76954.1 ATP-binding cassette domain-containing protein [Actinopolyspora sp. BKK1]
MSSDGVGITARGITARGPLGPVFENVDVTVQPGELAMVAGPSGTGRTSLLLALSGRLRTVAGRIEVGGHKLPRHSKKARQLVVPALLRPGFELERCWRVREAVRERRVTSRIGNTDVSEAFALVGIDPEPEALIGSLHPGERLLLAVALGAAASPAGLLVDDVELGLPAAARVRVWTALKAVSATGTTVLVSTTDPPSFAAGPVIRLPRSDGDSEEEPRHDTRPDIATPFELEQLRGTGLVSPTTPVPGNGPEQPDLFSLVEDTPGSDEKPGPGGGDTAQFPGPEQSDPESDEDGRAR